MYYVSTEIDLLLFKCLLSISSLHKVWIIDKPQAFCHTCLSGLTAYMPSLPWCSVSQYIRYCNKWRMLKAAQKVGRLATPNFEFLSSAQCFEGIRQPKHWQEHPRCSWENCHDTCHLKMHHGTSACLEVSKMLHVCSRQAGFSDVGCHILLTCLVKDKQTNLCLMLVSFWLIKLAGNVMMS